MLEHVPDPGEESEFEGWQFTAEEVEGRRVRLVRVREMPTTDVSGVEIDGDEAFTS